MGTIKKKITICDEDILNLKNARDIIINATAPPDDFPLEILTIDAIIERWQMTRYQKLKWYGDEDSRECTIFRAGCPAHLDDFHFQIYPELSNDVIIYRIDGDAEIVSLDDRARRFKTVEMGKNYCERLNKRIFFRAIDGIIQMEEK